MTRLLRRIGRASDGATLVEFALIAPVFFALLMGLFDLGQSVYVRSTLQGALQEGGRNSGLESGSLNEAAIDTYVRDQVQAVTGNARVEFERLNYRDFSNVGTPEDFTDSNSNGIYDANECFFDANGNGQWDTDRGVDGLGGANDVVVYTATVTYRRIFPFYELIGLAPITRISASTILRNQPFSTQDVRQAKQICPPSA